VIFNDGIRPGTDLDEAVGIVPDKPPKFNMPVINKKTNSFIPEAAKELLPPVLLKEWVKTFRIEDQLTLVNFNNLNL
jgi:hypothetical protein